MHWHDVKEVSNLAFDHQYIFELSYKWLQKKIQEHPLGFSLLPKKFSLRELQNLYEAILDTKMDRRNFRKKFFAMDFLIDTNDPIKTDLINNLTSIEPCATEEIINNKVKNLRGLTCKKSILKMQKKLYYYNNESHINFINEEITTDNKKRKY